MWFTVKFGGLRFSKDGLRFKKGGLRFSKDGIEVAYGLTWWFTV